MITATPSVNIIAHTTLPVVTDSSVPAEILGRMELDGDDDSAGGAQSLVEFAGRACYQSFDKPNDATAANRDYIANILDQHHYSVLEHSSVTFYIQGVSRSLTHEFVRHRHLSYSQLSQRYVDSSDVRFVVPPALIGDVDAQVVLDVVAAAALVGYDDIVVREMAKGKTRKQAREAARSVLPNMTETKVTVTGNYRAWIEFLVKRDNPAADAEIQRLAKMIGAALADIAPAVFDDDARCLWDDSFAQRVATQ